VLERAEVPRDRAGRGAGELAGQVDRRQLGDLAGDPIARGAELRELGGKQVALAAVALDEQARRGAHAGGRHRVAAGAQHANRSAQPPGLRALGGGELVGDRGERAIDRGGFVVQLARERVARGRRGGRRLARVRHGGRTPRTTGPAVGR
jgi:hypothetical protein